MLADLDALAVQDVALELAIHPERAGHHDRPADGRVHADDRVRRQRLLLRRLMTELEHENLPVSEDAPGLEQPLEVLLAVVFELDLPAAAAGRDRNLGRELLLELGLHVRESVRPRGPGLGLHRALPPADERLRPADRETLARDVAGGRQQAATALEPEERPGVPGAQCST